MGVCDQWSAAEPCYKQEEKAEKAEWSTTQISNKSRKVVR